MVIALSVVYVGVQGLRGRPTKWTVTGVVIFAVGLVHGLGLSTRLQALGLPEDGVVWRVIAFNVGVELGQFTALAFVLLAIAYWRRRPSFLRHAWAANVLLMSSGLLLIGYQLSGYYVSKG